jgi:hypothetical protein
LTERLLKDFDPNGRHESQQEETFSFPYRRAAVEILIDARRTIEKRHRKTKSRIENMNRRNRAIKVLYWVELNDEDSVFSFINCCDWLELNIDLVREKMRNIFYNKR